MLRGGAASSFRTTTMGARYVGSPSTENVGSIVSDRRCSSSRRSSRRSLVVVVVVVVLVVVVVASLSIAATTTTTTTKTNAKRLVDAVAKQSTTTTQTPTQTQTQTQQGDGGHEVELWSYEPPTTDDVSTTRWRGWDDFEEPSRGNLYEMEDSRLRSEGEIVPIGYAHDNGSLHRGVWVAVLRRRANRRYEVLLLKRSPRMRTCPGAWGLTGEHSDAGESWETTAKRATREELGLDDDDDVVALGNLLPGRSVLVRCRYENDDKKHELQATGLLYALVSSRVASASSSSEHRIRPDDEVDGPPRWVPVEELRTMRCCNDEITALIRLVGELLTTTTTTSILDDVDVK